MDRCSRTTSNRGATLRRTWGWLLVLAVVVGCGDSRKPGVGTRSNDNRNNDNNIIDDMGNIFPEVGPTSNQPNNNEPEDMPRDMPPVEMDMPDPPDMPEDMAEDMAMNCPRMDVTYNGACACNQECATGRCVDASASEDGFCSLECNTNDDCPEGDACVTDRFGDSVCRFDDTGDDCTSMNQAAPDMCSTGHCLQAGSNFAQDFFCSVPCDTADDCKLGHSCAPVRCQFTLEGYSCIPTVIAQRANDPDLVLMTFPDTRKLCIAVGAPNPCGDMTMSSDEQACPGSLCDNNPTGRCTAQCVTTNDCPAGGCVDYDLSNQNLPIRVCDI